MQPGYDVILVARGRAVRSTYQQLDETYLHLLRQAGLVPEETEMCIRDRRPAHDNGHGVFDVGLLHLRHQRAPVSYTHLDVYKRQPAS